MKIRTVLSLAAVLLFPVILSSEEEAEKIPPEKQAVYELFEAQGMREQMDHIRIVMIENQLKEVPELAGCMLELNGFYLRCVGYEALKNELAEIYLKHFSVDEIRQITAFYRSPVGRKMKTVSADILLESNELAKKRMEAEIPNFFKELKEKGKLKE